MARSLRMALSSVTHILGVVTDRVSGADIVREDRRQTAQAHQRISARIDAVRKGFCAIRERHEALSGRISAARRQRR